jgi:hypothetical protein
MFYFSTSMHVLIDISLSQGTAEFYCPDHLTKELELKAACVGFRKDLWYHLNFLARCRRGGDAVETRRFFAEIRFEPSSDRLIVETCVVLGIHLHARDSIQTCYYI